MTLTRLHETDSKEKTLYMSAVRSAITVPGRSGNNLTCYILTDHTEDPSIISSIASTMLQSGCRRFVFCGQKKNLWNQIFDEADLMMHRRSGRFSMLVAERDAEHLRKRILMDMHLNPSADHLLLYDDMEALKRMWKNQLFNSSPASPLAMR